MTLLAPIWAVLVIPLGFALWRWLPAAGPRRALRVAGSLLLIAALCRPVAWLPRGGGTLIVVADRSDSMPEAAEELMGELIERLEATRGGSDRLAVVAFGASPSVERLPGGERFAGFAAEVGAQQSDLAGALDAALTLAPLGGASRILVLSDGRFTGADPQAGGGRSTLRGVPIDYRLIERPATGDVAIAQLAAPEEVSPGEGFLITGWVQSPVAREVEVELRRGDQVVGSSRRRVPAGRSRFTFRDRAAPSGVAGYRLTVRSAGTDPVPENNRAAFLVATRGPRPLLVVSDSTSGGPPAGGLVALLRAGGLDVQLRRPEDLRGTLDELGAVSAVLIEGVPASRLGEQAQRNLAAWVEDAGGGLMLTGGPRSFGPGGYFRSPLDPILPVSMELRQEHRKMALAMVVALDRSGSMAVQVAGGRSKMDLANLATVAVLDLLSPLDEFGVVAVDSTPHLVAPLAPVEDVAATRRMILRISSAGGGIFVYEALHAAAEQLLEAKAGARHILLFADAADAEAPGAYVALLERCREAGITVSTVGLGRSSDVDAGLLRDVAERGGGRSFFTQSAGELPRLFAQDTFVVSRSAFVEQETAVRFTPAWAGLTLLPIAGAPAIGGYNLTYLRPEARLAAVTTDDYQAPFVAAWQAGVGRALAYTAEVDGEHSGPIAGWAGLGEMLTSLARWTAGEGAGLDDRLLVTREIRGGNLVVRIHLEPERDADPFVRMPEVSVLRGVPGREPVREEGAVRWVDPDVLEADLPLYGDEVALATVEVPGHGRRTLAPVRLPYGPEFAPVEPERGRRTLDGLAKAAGGRPRVEVSELWDEFPRRPRPVEITPWLLAVVIVLLLAEVLERRTAVLAGLWSRRSSPRRSQPPKVEAGETAPSPTSTPSPSAPSPAPEPTPGPTEPPDVVDALARARRRASRRTGR